ncbi:MAG: hypothetical protein ABGZ17_13325 [Planctomycetaceae bacterium]
MNAIPQRGRDGLLTRLHWNGSARHLALIRIVVGLHLVLWVFGSDYLSYVGRFSTGSNPVYWSVIPAAWITSSVAQTMQWVGLLACVLMVLGLCTRVATVLTTVSFLVTNQFYYVNTGFHDDWLYFNFILLTLSCARCGDAWSIDAWLGTRRRETSRTPIKTQVYRWPVEVMLGWFCLLYVEAGVAKLFPLEHGMAWFTGGTIQSVAIARLLDSPIYWWFGRALFDYRIQWPFVVMSIVAVVIELAAVIPLLTRRWNGMCYAAVMGLHLGIYSVGVPGFPQIALACGCLFLRPEWFGDCGADQDCLTHRDAQDSPRLKLAA